MGGIDFLRRHGTILIQDRDDGKKAKSKFDPIG
jgi:hypothetical protein